VYAALAVGAEGDAELYQPSRPLVQRAACLRLPDRLPGLGQLRIAFRELLIGLRGSRFFRHAADLTRKNAAEAKVDAGLLTMRNSSREKARNAQVEQDVPLQPLRFLAADS